LINHPDVSLLGTRVDGTSAEMVTKSIELELFATTNQERFCQVSHLFGLLVDKDDLTNYQLLGLLMIVDNVWKLTNTGRVGLDVRSSHTRKRILLQRMLPLNRLGWSLEKCANNFPCHQCVSVYNMYVKTSGRTWRIGEPQI
jgi:hypothetical protein